MRNSTKVFLSVAVLTVVVLLDQNAKLTNDTSIADPAPSVESRFQVDFRSAKLDVNEAGEPLLCFELVPERGADKEPLCVNVSDALKQYHTR